MKKSSFVVVLVVLMLLITSGCRKQVFSGSCTGNSEQFLLDYSVLNCTKTHEMQLKKDTSISVSVINKSGHVDILVTDGSGAKIYKADDASSGDFSIKTPKTDTYKFSITGKKAKGSVSFIVEK